MIDNAEVNITAEPPAAYWRDPATYDRVLKSGFIVPLEEAVLQHGHAPRTLQLALMQQLHWYFTVDLRERAPTVALTSSKAPDFHSRVRQIMRHIDAEVLEAAELQQVGAEVRHALLSYQAPVLHSTVALDAYDHDQGLVRLCYYVHGDPPDETFLIDGRSTRPAYSKYRACRYFHQGLLRQRIVWLPVANATLLEVRLNGMVVHVALGLQPFSISSTPALIRPLLASELLSAARTTYPPGKGGQLPLPPGWTGWKVRLLRALARIPMVRNRFAKAWVFMDREEDADDNAEHLYRWVRQHHPEINAWFLLSRSSTDWGRLAVEGFRLVPPGLTRQLLVLNSEHIISSHAECEFGGFDRTRYGDLMRWRFCFVPHGISKDDVSHWLGNRAFDLFVTTSPAEHASIVDNDTPYSYTGREVRYSGLPRRDRLLELVAQASISEVRTLLVMPTWRAGLVDERMAGSMKDRMVGFASSDYAQHWRALLNSEELRELTLQYGLNLMFMAHPNAAPFIKAFAPPAYVKVLTKADTSFMPLLCRSVALITDYTSVAFEMAFLRRMVFYYHFDRDGFYGGDHNWRPGYFDYDRDGFGPVSVTQDELVGQIRRFLFSGNVPTREYLERMERAMPDIDAHACQRVFKNILAIREPIEGRR